jgi:hypothetical protein
MRNHCRHQSVQTTIALFLGLFLLGQSAPRVLAAATTNAPDINIPESVFIIPSNVTQGRDPFFPLSQRLLMNATPANTNNVKVAPVTLALKGISGTDSKRFALINDKTFIAGEERDVFTGASRVRVHCIEIRENSVTVEVNGTRQEIRLRPGL